MAAYAATVVVQGTMLGIGHGALAWGTVDLTNYNTTNAAITGLSQLFGGAPPKKLIVSAISDNGYIGLWDETNNTVKAYYPTATSDQTPTADITAAAATEVANDVDVGKFHWLAFG